MNENAVGENTQAGELAESLREARYLREVAEKTISRLLAVDLQSIAIRHELEQKRRGFRLMAELAVAMGQGTNYDGVLVSVSQRINSTLNMHRTVVLFPEKDGIFRVAVLQGYPEEERKTLSAKCVPINAELLDPLKPTLITGADPYYRLEVLRETLKLPYLIASPIILHNEVVALLIVGRTTEQRPFSPRLDLMDVETVQTVGAYLTAVLASHRLWQAENQVRRDPLTKLLNLRGVTEQLQHALAMAKRGSFLVAVMFIDLDGFKAVNDTFGHAVGDIVLQAVAERLAHSVRITDVTGRLGGDEFVGVLTNIKQPEDAGLVAQKIIKKIGEPLVIGDNILNGVKIGASIGIALFPDDAVNEESLLHAADAAMYVVKSRGKGNFAFAGEQV